MAALETPEFLKARHRQVRRPGLLQPLRRGLGARDGHALPVDQAGRLALGRHAQRHDRPLAERHQGARAKSARSSTTSSTSRRRSSKRPGCPSRSSVNGVQQQPDRGRQHALLLRRRQGGRTARDAVLRDVRQPRHLPQGLDRGDAAQHALGADRREDPAFDDDVWELYDTDKDWSQANDLSKQMPEKLHELQRLWLIEATRYNVLPIDDRPRRALQPGHRRPAGADQGKHPAAVRRHGPPVGKLRPQHQEQVPLGHRRDRGAGHRRRGRDHRPGREHRRLEPVRQGRQAQILLQPGRRAALLRRSRERAARRASTRCAWSSPTPAAASARAAR